MSIKIKPFGVFLKIIMLWVPMVVCNAAVFTVTNTNDSGVGSLRQAILDANSSGAGPHTINFDVLLNGQTIFLSSSLPQVTVSDVTIDGDIDGDGTGDITIDAGSGDNNRNIFRANGNGNNATFKGFILQDTGYEPFRFDGSPSGITIQDIVSLHNDGNYFNQAILFAGNAVGLTVLNFTHNNPQSGQHGIQITGTADNILIDGFNYQNGSGGTAIAIRFVGAATNVTIRNSLLDLDLFGSNNDGDYGIYFQNSASDITLENVTINEADVDGVRVLDADNFTIDGSSFINCYDGIEFYNNYARTNNVIQNSVFDNNERAGLVINVSNAITQYDISGNTFSNHSTNDGNGVWLFSTGGVKAIEITTNTFFNNNVGIYNEQADDILYSQNSFYNNGTGIDNVGNNGNNGYERADGEVPVFVSSEDVGGGNYEVTFTLPAFCTDCDVEFYTNESSDIVGNARNYIQTVNSLVSGSHMVTLNSGGNTTGYWTALLTNNDNGSTSELSDAFGIVPIGPGGVNTGLSAWYVSNSLSTVSLWKDESLKGIDVTATGIPTLLESSINFNRAFDFPGSRSAFFSNSSKSPLTSGSDATVFYVGSTHRVNGNYDVAVGFNGSDAEDPSIGLLNNGFFYYDNNSNTSIANGPTVGVDSPYIQGLSWLNNSSGEFLINGATFQPITPYNITTADGGFRIGSDGPSGVDESYFGSIAEVIVYNEKLAPADVQKIETYLAIKFGITLSSDNDNNGSSFEASNGDGINEGDYVAEDGVTVVWDASANQTYHNDIAGIGRDDFQALGQKQSKSVNGDAIVTIGLGEIATSNIANPNNFTTDKSFLLWGNDDGNTALQTTEIPIGASAVYRMGREWKVQETGAVSNLALTFEINPTAWDPELYIDSDGDGDFTNATVVGGTVVDGKAVFSGVDLNDGDLFTIGYSVASPGGVVSNLTAWYKFNAGVSSGGEGTAVSAIADMSGNGLDLFESSAGSQPTYVENSLNFNPGGDFDGGNDRLNGQYLNFVDETDPVTLISVSVPTSFGGERRTISIGGGYDRPGLGYQGAGGNMQIRVTDGSPATIEHSVPLTLNTPYILWSSITNGSSPGEALLSYNGMNNEESTNLADGIYPLANASSEGYIALGNEPNTYSDDHVGLINEGIVYNRVLEQYEKERVYSYLAIKYGITLNQDYYAGDWDGSTGTRLWDMTFNALYNNDIAGIGRDDSWALNQKQSQSVNGDALVTIGLGGIEADNVSNSNVFNTEESFLLWGNDDGTTTVVNAGIPPVFAEKLTRNWLIAETGSVEDVMVRIPSTLASGFTDASDLALVVADDANFSSNVQSVPMTLNGSYLEVLFNFEGTKYFSFGVISSGDFMRHGKYFQGGVEKPMKF